MPQTLVGAGGFLCAVLWMDLMFDVQAWSSQGTLAAEQLSTLVSYYRRVTTDADPMGSLISLVMILALVGCVVQLSRSRLPLWLRLATLATLLAPVLTALILIVPSAVRLGSGGDDPAVQSALARTILTGHLWCLASIVAFVILQILATARLSRAGS